MNDIAVMVSYRVQPGHVPVALSAIASLVSTVLATEPACKGIEMLQDASDQTRVTLLERWPSEHEFGTAHAAAAHPGLHT